uniref:F5/8 type C domain-containing protein n=1 Tax=Panagrellus redivivus TaxID=6233 RepID=A0A7E4WAV5_PANRE
MHVFALFARGRRPVLLKHIDFYLLRKRHVDMLFGHIQLVTRKCFVNLLSEQQIQTTKIKTVVNQNVIDGMADLRIVEGALGCRSINIGTSPNGAVIFDLKHNYLLNCLKLTNVFPDRCFHYGSNMAYYTVSISMDMRNWKYCSGNPIDNEVELWLRNPNEIDACDELQVLNFKESVVRFIRIKGADRFCGVSPSVNIEALLLTNSAETLSNAETTRAQEIIYRYIESMKRLYQDDVEV